MTPHDTYRNNRVTGWTRVEMLISLYDAAIGKLQQALKALRGNEHGTAALLLLQSSRLVFGIQLGLDMDYGDVPKDINRLCEFVNHCVSESSPQKVESAIRVLTSLRDALVEIRFEAIELERAGKTPRFEDVAPSGVLA